MAKNYYLILGISEEATLGDIKSAYRRLAKEFHPDLSGRDSSHFTDIQEAYSVLSDNERRRCYDRSLERLRDYRPPHYSGPEPLSPNKRGPEPIKPFDESPTDLGKISLLRSFDTFAPSFDEIFDRLWSNFTHLAPPKAERNESLNVEIPLSPQQARQGGQVRIMIPVQAVCPVCNGRGGIGYYECGRCAGEGAISGEYPVHINFPAGIPDDYQVSVPLNSFGIRNTHLVVHFRLTG